MSNSKERSSARTPSALQQVWQQRTDLVKQEVAAASAANDAKTLRLRALRLEKERLEAEAAVPGGDVAKIKPRQPRPKRIVAG